jgi:hypothetical protein
MHFSGSIPISGKAATVMFRLTRQSALLAVCTVEWLSEARLAVTHLRAAILGKELNITIIIIIYGQDIKTRLINLTLHAKLFLVSSFDFCHN